MADKIKVLIVDDNENTRDGTARLLEYEDNIEIVGFAENGAIAVERVKELHPQVVLMDINMPVMNGIEATQQISQIAPTTKVIMVSVQDDSQYLKNAFRAGAVDFVAKPITSAELAEAIVRAYKQYQAEAAAPPPAQAYQPGPGTPAYAPMAPGMPPSQEGKVIGILGFKGGMGKTTVAVSLGAGLALAGKKTILVDCNLFFGDVGLFLNTKAQHTIIDFAHMAAEPDQFDFPSADALIAAHPQSGLKLLIAPSKPGEAELLDSAAIANVITVLRRMYDYVIIDTSSGFDEVLLGVIQNADSLVLLLTPTMPAIKDGRFMLDELIAVGFIMDGVHLVLNQVMKTGRITAEQISNYLKVPVKAQVPFDPTAVESVFDGIPLISRDPRQSPAVQGLMSVVQLVKEQFDVRQQAAAGAGEPEKKSGGWFSRG